MTWGDCQVPAVAGCTGGLGAGEGLGEGEGEPAGTEGGAASDSSRLRRSVGAAVLV